MMDRLAFPAALRIKFRRPGRVLTFRLFPGVGQFALMGVSMPKGAVQGGSLAGVKIALPVAYYSSLVQVMLVSIPIYCSYSHVLNPCPHAWIFQGSLGNFNECS